jgi:hypothetical protein
VPNEVWTTIAEAEYLDNRFSVSYGLKATKFSGAMTRLSIATPGNGHT